MNESIVVGTDGSFAARAAIRWAVQRAALLSLNVDIVHVIDDEWGVHGELSMDELHPDIAELLRSAVALAQAIDPRVTIRARAQRGDPMVELAEASRAAQMVVVGTHKTGFFHGRAFGSRSLQLAGMAWSPVAVIPETNSQSRRGVVVGVADSPAGRAAVAFGAAEALATDQQLILVRALDDHSGEPGLPHSVSPLSLEQSELIAADAMELAKSIDASGPVRARAIHRPVAEALVNAAMSARLLIIGSSRRRGAEISALGPTCHDVLMNITGPTIVVHSDTAGRAFTSFGQRSRTA